MVFGGSHGKAGARCQVSAIESESEEFGTCMHFFRLHTQVLNIPHTLQVKTFSLCSIWHLVGKTVDGSIGDVKDEPGSPRGLAQMISG